MTRAAKARALLNRKKVTGEGGAHEVDGGYQIFLSVKRGAVQHTVNQLSDHDVVKSGKCVIPKSAHLIHAVLFAYTSLLEHII